MSLLLSIAPQFNCGSIPPIVIFSFSAVSDEWARLQETNPASAAIVSAATQMVRGFARAMRG
jgi:hypothetical protein